MFIFKKRVFATRYKILNKWFEFEIKENSFNIPGKNETNGLEDGSYLIEEDNEEDDDNDNLLYDKNDAFIESSNTIQPDVNQAENNELAAALQLPSSSKGIVTLCS